jgi:hypothetical protein
VGPEFLHLEGERSCFPPQEEELSCRRQVPELLRPLAHRQGAEAWSCLHPEEEAWSRLVAVECSPYHPGEEDFHPEGEASRQGLRQEEAAWLRCQQEPGLLLRAAEAWRCCLQQEEAAWYPRLQEEEAYPRQEEGEACHPPKAFQNR